MVTDNIVQFPRPSELEADELLARKIVELLNAETEPLSASESKEAAFNGLLTTLLWFFASICPDCRLSAGKYLKKELPRMLCRANELAKHDDVETCH